MSRSRRKNPIISITMCRSERQDKKIWHKRWRALERTALTSTDPEVLENHLTLSEKQVSNVWSMGKDGKQYWSIASQQKVAEAIANQKGKTPRERQSLKNRLAHKAMRK